MPPFGFANLDLASEPGRALVADVRTRFGERIAAMANLPRRLFVIRSAWAPGLAFIGGEVDALGQPSLMPEHPPFSLAGSGEALPEALVSCLGEGVERLSQIERTGDIVQRLAGKAILPAVSALLDQIRAHNVTTTAQYEPDWCRGISLASGEPVLVPTDWCLRRRSAPHAIPGAALSTGAAAGPTEIAAGNRALLELVERDAAAIWWIGGRRGRPVALEAHYMSDATRLLGAVRQGVHLRRSWLLDITTDLGIPVFAAISVDESGQGFVCGTAARLSVAEAARAAICEMCQLEIGLQLVAIKTSERGEAALNAVDRRQIARATQIDAETFALIHPTGTPHNYTDFYDPEETPDDMADRTAIATRMAAACIDACLVTLTRPEFNIPVVHAVAPGLQLMPSALETIRLSAIRDLDPPHVSAVTNLPLF